MTKRKTLRINTDKPECRLIRKDTVYSEIWFTITTPGADQGRLVNLLLHNNDQINFALSILEQLPYVCFEKHSGAADRLSRLAEASHRLAPKEDKNDPQKT